jgi:hypothetical protein
MSAESGESGKRESSVSGSIHLKTDQGLLIIEITSGEIIFGDIDNIVPRSYLEVRNRLDQYIHNLPAVESEDSRQSNHWISGWDAEHAKYGNCALITLFPRNTDRDVRFVTRTLNALARASSSDLIPESIQTKSALINTPNRVLASIPGFGAKSLKLTILMRDVALVEHKLNLE